MAPGFPWLVIPIARRVLRQMVGHLVLDATPEKLGPAIATLRESGNRLNLNLLGEAVLGEDEANRRLQGTHEFLARDDVDYVSIKVSSVVSQLSMWSFDEAVQKVVAKLTPLYELAAASEARGRSKFINLDMEEYRDLDLTIAVFTTLLDQPQLRGLEAGIVLQTYLPDALGAMQELTAWAKQRRAAGGAPIKVRVVKGANLAMEHVDAAIHGWPVATYSTKQDSDTNYKRVLDWSMTPERTDAVKLGVAGHNLFDVAHAWLTAIERNVADRVEFEMLLGMATGQAEAVRRDVGNLLLYTPVVNPSEFDVAIAYLIRRLEENASHDNFMSAVFELADDRGLFDREMARFQRSLDALRPELVDGADVPAPTPNRTQDRHTEWQGDALAAAMAIPAAPAPGSELDDDASLTSVVLGITRGSDGGSELADAATSADSQAPAGPGATPGFRNEPDTDPALAANRDWGRRILARVPGSRLGLDTIAAARVDDSATLDGIIQTVAARGRAWGELPGAERAAVLHRAGLALAANRDRLIEVMAAEAGKTIAEADPEISEAIDFAHYYAERARELDHVQGAVFVPPQLTVVTPPWNFPVAIPAGGVLAALAAGSGVIIKPAKLAQRSGAVMVEALWEAGRAARAARAGRPREPRPGPAARRRARGRQGHPHRCLRDGAAVPLVPQRPAAARRDERQERDHRDAERRPRPRGIRRGQERLRTRGPEVLGRVARDPRRLGREVRAVPPPARRRGDVVARGLPGRPAEPDGPDHRARERQAAARAHAARHRRGVARRAQAARRRPASSGRPASAPASPRARTSTSPSSSARCSASCTRATSMRRSACRTRSTTASPRACTRSTPTRSRRWLDRVEAGNLYVNRGITGAIVQRQPFGGWKRSAVGAGAKAGGPNYLFGLGDWMPQHGHTSSTLHLRGLEQRVSQLIELSQSALDYEAFEVLRRSALSDELAWAEEYGATKDVSGVGVERNLFRYRPLPVTVRIGERATLAEGLRVIAAGLLANAPLMVSTAVELPQGVRRLLEAREFSVVREGDGDWLARAARGGITTPRVRLIGGGASALADALGGTPDIAVWSHPVTPSGRVELLPFLHEQAISITNHRFGNPTTISDGVI